MNPRPITISPQTTLPEKGGLSRQGLLLFVTQSYLDGTPQYAVFNGWSGTLRGNITANVGNGSVNLISNFHGIGEIFQRVDRLDDLLTVPAEGLQTTLIPAGSPPWLNAKLSVRESLSWLIMH